MTEHILFKIKILGFVGSHAANLHWINPFVSKRQQQTGGGFKWFGKQRRSTDAKKTGAGENQDVWGDGIVWAPEWAWEAGEGERGWSRGKWYGAWLTFCGGLNSYKFQMDCFNFWTSSSRLAPLSSALLLKASSPVALNFLLLPPMSVTINGCELNALVLCHTHCHLNTQSSNCPVSCLVNKWLSLFP